MSRSRSPDVPEIDLEWAEGRHSVQMPEERLLVAVVRRAVWDFVLYRECARADASYELAVDAAGWIFWDGEEEVDEEGRYTFLYICQYLGLDAQYVRKIMLKLTRQDLQKLNNYIKE